GKSAGYVIAVLAAADFAIKKTRRLEDQQHDPLDGRFQISAALELPINEEALLLCAKRPPKGTLSKPPAEFANANHTIRGVVLGAGQLAQMLDHIPGDLDSRVRGRPLPRLGDRRSTFVADTTVIRWKRAAHDQHFRKPVGRQAALGDYLR